MTHSAFLPKIGEVTGAPIHARDACNSLLLSRKDDISLSLSLSLLFGASILSLLALRFLFDSDSDSISLLISATPSFFCNPASVSILSLRVDPSLFLSLGFPPTSTHVYRVSRGCGPHHARAVGELCVKDTPPPRRSGMERKRARSALQLPARLP